jgi:hypothetical protein
MAEAETELMKKILVKVAPVYHSRSDKNKKPPCFILQPPYILLNPHNKKTNF